MQIGQISSIKSKQSFGVQYSDDVVSGFSSLTDRVFDITAHKHKKYRAFKADIDSRFDANAQIDVANWDGYVKRFQEDCAKLNKMRDSYKFYKRNLRQGLDRMDKVLPNQTLYTYVSPKGKAYFAIDIDGKRNIVAPMRTWQNQNPLENPRAVRISLDELKKIASKLEWIDMFESVKSSVKKIFRM